MELILASGSPRRRELLSKFGVSFSVLESGFYEKTFSSNPKITAETFAKRKAEDVFDNLSDKRGKIVLGADTVVYNEKKILGKPRSENEAFDMLKSLSGKTHTVITGYCIKSSEETLVDSELTEVTFNALSDEQIISYIESGTYKGKAGGYGIQDDFPLVKEYRGNLNNVIGLPTERIIPLLIKFGVNRK